MNANLDNLIALASIILILSLATEKVTALLKTFLQPIVPNIIIPPNPAVASLKGLVAEFLPSSTVKSLKPWRYDLLIQSISIIGGVIVAFVSHADILAMAKAA